ncbi:GNAT family N-acetyltransferase [Natronomonas sp. EA1]|uniref:GNAT family N-acetyltransferase n=1 Tax=Natronomonas sp. EA1 TaxID=3421655 RepID=UPI003EB83A6B
MNVREATAEEAPTVESILNAAMLEVPEEGTQYVACEGERILGSLVLIENEIDAIAVRPGRRGQGVGRALVAHVAGECETIFAHFDPKVRPFYEKLGFDIEEGVDGRLCGTRNSD